MKKRKCYYERKYKVLPKLKCPVCNHIKKPIKNVKMAHCPVCNGKFDRDKNLLLKRGKK